MTVIHVSQKISGGLLVPSVKLHCKHLKEHSTFSGSSQCEQLLSQISSQVPPVAIIGCTFRSSETILNSLNLRNSAGEFDQLTTQRYYYTTFIFCGHVFQNFSSGFSKTCPRCRKFGRNGVLIVSAKRSIKMFKK